MTTTPSAVSDRRSKSTVVLILSAPLMAWGLDADWETRPTLSRPTKSGVLGMIANAQGRDRADDITDLAALRFSVRGDRPGHVIIDDQTAGGGTFPPLPADYALNPTLADKPDNWTYGAPRGPRALPDGRLVAPWTAKDRSTMMIKKAYLADAAFLCGLTGDPGVVNAIAEAVNNPHRLLYYGRRHCAPDTAPLHLVTDEPHWELRVPLIDRATTTAPRFWYETTPSEGRPSPEHPDRYDTHQYTGMFIADTRVTPPPQGGRTTS